MAKKKIEMVVTDTCENCPFIRWEYDDHPNYSGYFCNKEDEKIAGDNADSDYSRALKKWEQNQKEISTTLFPIVKMDKPVDPMLIPNWCPLPDAE